MSSAGVILRSALQAGATWNRNNSPARFPRSGWRRACSNNVRTRRSGEVRDAESTDGATAQGAGLQPNWLRGRPCVTRTVTIGNCKADLFAAAALSRACRAHRQCATKLSEAGLSTPDPPTWRAHGEPAGRVSHAARNTEERVGMGPCTRITMSGECAAGDGGVWASIWPWRRRPKSLPLSPDLAIHNLVRPCKCGDFRRAPRSQLHHHGACWPLHDPSITTASL